MWSLPCGSAARRRTRGLTTATLLAVVCGLPPLLSHRAHTATATATTTLTFSAAADTYVDGSNVKITFGTAKTLIADHSPVKIIYLRFVVSGVNGRQVQSSRLKLGVNLGGAPGG